MSTTPDTINLGIFAHVDAGKTTLTEQLLYVSGAVRSAGNVDSGTTQTDYTDVERDRHISVSAASAQFEYKGTKINLIDTPGHMDFSSEVERALRVIDCAILVVSAVEGIQARTEIVWEALEQRKTPTVIFINKLDRAGSGFAETLQALKAYSDAVTPFTQVLKEGLDGFEIRPVKEDSIAEAVALTDMSAMDIYMEGSLSGPELDKALRKAVSSRDIIPVFAGSAAMGLGVSELLDGAVRLMPRAEGDENGPLAALVYKVEHNKSMGRMCHVRMFSGRLSNRDTIDIGKETAKIAQIRRVTGGKHSDIGTVRAGEIAALCGIGAKAGDILGDERLVPRPTNLTEPLLNVKVTCAPEDFTKLTEAVHQLTEEDPLLKAFWVKEKRELTLSVTGTIQLEIIDSLLKTRWGVNARFGPPSVIYRETPAGKGYGFDAYTMPKPCWAILKFLIEPLPRGSGVQYSSIVENNKIFYRYQSQVEDAIPTALRQGPSGWQVTDLRITLVDGEHHTIHTHPLDFAVATPMAMMNGLVSIGTVMLEPILRFRLTVPEESLGKIMTELVNIRGDFEMGTAKNGRCRLEGTYPVSSGSDFPAFVTRVTGGKGVLSAMFDGYRDCPQELCQPTEYRGISPLDRAKYILWVRKALTDAEMHL
ncbi:MAG: TetM/TetW/TetO/TetS family tetracycline resistance ribosomal protection protein [Clostridia bacterium]|nr:TetM/TetW/TetO/TetS family tetracycline resistance ribosomal protection protein [Clostridia bacterium]